MPVDPRAKAWLDRRRSRRRRGLGDGQGHHRAPHSIPHRMVLETLTLLDPRYLALANGGTAVVRGRPPASLAGDRAKENTDEHQHDLAELLGQEWSEMMDYRALATMSVTMAELRRGKLATKKTMWAYRSSAAAANLTTVKQRGWRSTGRSRLAGGAETRARELAEATAATRRRRRTRERADREGNGVVHATGGAAASCRTHWGLTSGTNSDVWMPLVQTRGITGELPWTDGDSIQSLIPTETRLCTAINS